MYKKFLQGEHLYLREVRESDVNDQYYSWMNDPEINRYMETRFFPQSEKSIAQYVQSHSSGPAEVFWALCLNENDLHIGNGKLGPINWMNRNADVSLFIGDKTYWGKGLASEAIGLFVHYGFHILGLHRFRAGMYVNNVGSKRAFEKNGFQVEGIFKEYGYVEGNWMDCYTMGLTRPQYESFLEGKGKREQ